MSNRFKMQIYKGRVILIVLCVVLSLSLMTGCFSFRGRKPKKPSEEELVSAVEELVKGENIEYSGNGRFYSLDRDIEFEEQWVLYAQSSGGTDAPRGTGYGSYYLDSNLLTSQAGAAPNIINYYTTVYRYWLDDICEEIDSYQFESVEVIDKVTERRIGRDFYIPITIYITQDITPEQVEAVESLLREFRDICIKEQQFHDEYFDFSFCVEIIRWNTEEDLYFKGETYNVYADTKDSELEIDSILDWNVTEEQWNNMGFRRPSPDTVNNRALGGYDIVIIAG